MRILVIQNFKANGFKGVIGQELKAGDLEKIGKEAFAKLVADELVHVHEPAQASDDLEPACPPGESEVEKAGDEHQSETPKERKARLKREAAEKAKGS